MAKLKLMIIVIYLAVWPASFIPRRRKSENIQTLHRTGVAIAADNLIQEYEREHLQFYEEEETRDYLGWPDLDNKNLSNYCKKCLQYSIPDRNTSDTIGFTIRRKLHYEKVNTKTSSNVVIVQCTVMRKRYNLTYYITRAPNPSCVYALKSIGNWNYIILNIINKYCDFEDRKLVNNPLKRRREEVTNMIEFETGQPIAKDEYLLEYELEHKKLLKQEGNNENHMKWPHAIVHPNLDSYCYQYVGECAPNRNREGITGLWKTEILNYQKLDTNVEIRVMTVTCRTSDLCTLNYHMTRAPETNCVYALLRKGHHPRNPLIIVFKHCDFEDPNDKLTVPQSHDIDINVIPKIKVEEDVFANFKDPNNQRTDALQCHDILNKNELPKMVMKEEIFDTLEPLHLFPEV